MTMTTMSSFPTSTTLLLSLFMASLCDNTIATPSKVQLQLQL